MKKLLTLLLTVVMAVACCFGLTACGDDETTARTIDVNDQFSEYAEYLPEDFKIGFIFLHDEKSTYDLNFYTAAKEAVATMGLKSSQVVYKFNVPEGQECYDAAKELKEAGCKAIFANSFGHGSFILKAAQDFTDVQFFHATGTQASNLPAGVTNFHNAFASIYEGRYLGGVAAGMKLNEMLKAKETAKGSALTEEEIKAETKIGYVGAFPYAEVKSGYTSFYLGAKSVCPSVTMDVRFTNSWYDEVAEKAAAEALIASGAKLISQHADSMGAPSACEKAGVPNVSYNGSTISDCPNTFIISSRINWAPYFKAIIASFAVDENNESIIGDIPTDYVGTLSDGMVEISTINADVMAKGTVAKLQEVMDEFEDNISSAIVFNCANFTVTVPENNTTMTVDENKHLTSYLADVIDEGDYVGETNVIKTTLVNGKLVSYFNESGVQVRWNSEANKIEVVGRSAPYFDIDIDGITLINLD